MDDSDTCTDLILQFYPPLIIQSLSLSISPTIITVIMSLSLKRNAILQSSNLRRILNNKHLKGRNFNLASSLNQFQNFKIEKQNGFENVPDAPAVYAVFDAKEEVQYIGITRKVGLKKTSFLTLF